MRWSALLAVAAVFAVASPAFAIVLHGDELPVEQRPSSALVGRWMPSVPTAGKASCVAIAPNYILTSRHQGLGSPTVSFNIDGVDTQFKVVQGWTTGNVDLMVCRIETMDGQPAYLSEWAKIYTGSVTAGTEFVIGGYGQGRGSELRTSGGTLYGYTWSGADNDTLRWGKNTIDSTSTQSYGVYWGTASSSSLDADFDGTGAYQAGIALWDSGSPWLVKVGQEWQVAAVSTITRHYSSDYGPSQSWFKRPSNGLDYPDKFFGTYVAAYDNEWIWNTIPQPAPMAGDANGDGQVTDADYTLWADNYGATNATWQMGDWNNDRLVTDADYTIWADHYGDGMPGDVPFSAFIADGTVPEPASLTLLALAGLLVRRRR